MKPTAKIIVISALLAFCSTSLADELLVPSQYSTIQSAIDAAVDGDEIIVSLGTYYENIHFSGRDITLRSSNPEDPCVVAATIIDGRFGRSVVTFAGSESAQCALSGFTITRGKGAQYWGGVSGPIWLGAGICGNGTLATIANNIIRDNCTCPPISPCSSSGGGIWNCDGIIRNNIITRNQASANEGGATGGGLSDCNGIIENNIIWANEVYGLGTIAGGGLANCGGIIRNNTILANRRQQAPDGLYSCNGTITNCIIWDSNIFSSSQPSYCCIQGWSGGGVGNISDNPKFVDPDTGDFHLQAGSTCIDAGQIIPELLDDFEGDSRPLGDGYDIGADEFVSNNSIPDQPNNLSPQDGDVNVSLTPTLQASTFSDPDPPDTHLASQWYVWVSDSNWGVFAITKSSDDLTSLTIPPRTLSDNINYSWQVRYQDNKGAWSKWSLPTAFTTVYTGDVITVPGDYQTIQRAIDAAIYGDEIVVAPGTYVENINFRGKNIILRSTDPADPCVIAITIINGNQAGSVVTFAGTEPPSCILSGFTITNGRGNERGGGIYGNGTLATIQNNTISGNLVEAYIAYGGGLYNCNGTIQYNTIFGNSVIGNFFGTGGGLYKCDGAIQDNLIMDNSATATGGPYSGSGGGLADCDGIIQNNTIKENSAGDGAGLLSCDGTVQNNIISGNFTTRANGHGGGLHQCHGIIQNNVICGNSAQGWGGGIYYSYGATIQNNTICHNSGSYGGGLSRCIYGDTVIRNCILWGNTCTRDGAQIYNSEPIYFSCIEGWTGGGLGNISADPCFIDAANGDYHLLPVSPCINTGDPNYVAGPNETDLDGLPRVIGGRIDMGTYEFNHQPVADAGPSQTVYAWLDGFANVKLDASASYDDDNDVLDYYWSWIIGGNTYEANGVNPTVKLPVGKHTIELVADDGIDLSQPDYCTITVIKAIRGKLMISPRVLETKSCGKWILATLLIPPVLGEKVNTNEPLRLYPTGIEVKYQRFHKYGMFRCAPTLALAFFDKQQVIDALGPGQVEVSVVGRFLTGRFFFGSDTIRIIAPPPHPKPPFFWH